MNSNNNITHKGKIIAIDAEITSVEIISEAACSSCHAKSLCSQGESKTKVIEVPTSGWTERKIGDEVEIVLKARLGHKAVWLAYGIPLIILVALLLGLSIAGVGELITGLSAIGSIAIYYLILWLFKSKIAKEYVFEIK